MKIRDMFWKLFWLMLRGKGNALILFDSEAVCFKAHMIEVDSAYFTPDEGSGLGDYLSLHWDSQVDQYVRIKGDIDDIQAVIKHINDKDDENSIDPLDSLDAHIIGHVKFDVKKYITDLKKIDLADLVKPEMTQEEVNSLINDASDSLSEKLERFKNFSQTEEDARAILKDAEKI